MNTECPECGLANLTTVSLAHSFRYGIGSAAVDVQVQLPLRRCSACGFEFLDQESQAIQDEAVNQAGSNK